MIVNELDLIDIPSLPPEADPPLIVDADTVLSLTITLESLETIRWRHC